MRQLERNLVQWQEKITTYRDMLSAQLAAYAEQSPKVDAYLTGNTLQVRSCQPKKLASNCARSTSVERSSTAPGCP